MVMGAPPGGLSSLEAFGQTLSFLPLDIAICLCYLELGQPSWDHECVVMVNTVYLWGSGLT